MLNPKDHLRGTRRNVLTLICGIVVGFAASADTALLLGVAWLLASFGYAETRYLGGERSRPVALWALGIAGLAIMLLIVQQYLLGTLLAFVAAGDVLQAWRIRTE